MEAQLLGQLEERRAEVARARQELDHLEAELAALARALRDPMRPLPALCSETSHTRGGET